MVRTWCALATAALLCLAACGGENEAPGDPGGEELAPASQTLAIAAAEGSEQSPAQAFFLMILVGPGSTPGSGAPVMAARGSGDAQSSPDPIPARPLGGEGGLTCGTDRQSGCDTQQAKKP